jgi:hypothetical protein
MRHVIKSKRNGAKEMQHADLGGQNVTNFLLDLLFFFVGGQTKYYKVNQGKAKASLELLLYTKNIEF